MIWFFTLYLESDSHLPKKICFICFNESPLKLMKNAFYFILNTLLVLKIFKFLSWLFGHVEKTAWLEHGTIIQTEITCNKISWYMRDSTCRWLIVGNSKIFQSYAKHFLIFPCEGNCRDLTGFVNEFSWIIQSCFLTRQ